MMHNNLNDASVSVHAGFPNPATDASLERLDLIRLLIPHPVSTFYLSVKGANHEGLGIFDGDIVVVDRALEPRNLDWVLYWEGDGFVIARLGALPAQKETWGVVTALVHQYRKSS